MTRLIEMIRSPETITDQPSKSDGKQGPGGSVRRQPRPEVRSVMLLGDEPVPINVGARGDCGLTAKLGKLKFVDVYDEKYLVAYSIVEGKSK